MAESGANGGGVAAVVQEVQEVREKNIIMVPARSAVGQGLLTGPQV